MFLTDVVENIGDGAVVAVFGYAVVFAGIVILMAIVSHSETGMITVLVLSHMGILVGMLADVCEETR